MNRNRSLLLALICAALAFSGSAPAQDSAPSGTVARPPEWDSETLRLFSSLPIQDDGRVKPLSTYAGFKLLKFNGVRSVEDVLAPPKHSLFGGERYPRLNPTEWLLNCLFYPEAAQHYPHFSIASSDVLDAIGVPHENKKKRDRYSYAELQPGIRKLFSLATEYSRKETKDMTPTERQIVNLAHNVSDFEMLIHYMDFARHDFEVAESTRLQELLPGDEEAEFTRLLEKMPLLRQLDAVLSAPIEGVDADTVAKERHALEHLINDVGRMGSMGSALAIFPPEGDPKQRAEWRTPRDITEAAFLGQGPSEHDLLMLGELEKLAAMRSRPEAFNEQLAAFHGQAVEVAQARGEYSRVPLEVFFYLGNKSLLLYTSVLYVVGLALLALLYFRPGTLWAALLAPLALATPTLFMGYPFFYGWILYVLSFVAVAVLWMRPQSPFLNRLAPIAIVAPTLLLVAGITMRCIIRHRPPVSTLYETILFITAVVVIVALVIEYMNRQKIALSMAALMGVMGLFLANKYEVKEGIDTMPSLVAVLDTNFWLATHVTTVTMGYGAGLLAAAVAHVYIFGRLFNFRNGDKSFYKTLARMTYGVICFGLFFSTLGTVLGGIWANDSWGRFWGWDPKENGALMIVLWELAMLHARAGGYLRDLGFAIWSVFGAIIVAFSWWGVNLLGVGLHSYGFTDGVAKTLLIFYGIELVVVLMGAAVFLRERKAALAPAPAPAPAPVPVTARRKAKGSAKAKATG